MKNLIGFIIFIFISTVLTGCYTQFAFPERNHNARNVKIDDADYYDEDSLYVDDDAYQDSTEAGYQYYDDGRFNNSFTFYGPIYSRYFWGYHPGRISFYSYGSYWDNYWAYGGWEYSPFFYDYYWHNNYPWDYYWWPSYHPWYYGDNYRLYGGGYYHIGSNRYNSYNTLFRERGNDGERTTSRRSAYDRISTSFGQPSITSGLAGRSSSSSRTSTLSQPAGRSSSASRPTVNPGERVVRTNEGTKGRSSSSDPTKITTPKTVTNPLSGRSSSSSSGRSAVSSGNRGSSSSSQGTRSSGNSGQGSRGSSSSSSSGRGSYSPPANSGSSSSSSSSSRGSSSSSSSSSSGSRGSSGRGR